MTERATYGEHGPEPITPFVRQGWALGCERCGGVLRHDAEAIEKAFADEMSRFYAAYEWLSPGSELRDLKSGQVVARGPKPVPSRSYGSAVLCSVGIAVAVVLLFVAVCVGTLWLIGAAL